MLPDVSPNVTINESAPSTVVELWGDELAYNRKYVTHRTLTPTCRYSLKVHSRLRHSSCKIRTINLSLSLSLSLGLYRCLACTANAGCTDMHQFCRQFDYKNFEKLWGI